jgi:hypothetical protein
MNDWHHRDLTADTGAPPPFGSLTGFAVRGTDPRVYYVDYADPERGVHELAYYQRGWHHRDLTAETGARDPGKFYLAGFAVRGTDPRVYYMSQSPVGPETHIHELAYFQEDQEEQTARVAVSYRIPLGGLGTEPSFGTVSFRGNLKSSTGNEGITSFERSDDWQAPVGSDFGLATFSIANLRVGRWTIEAREPLWVASCDVDLHDGTNENVNFQRTENGCARGFNFPN